MDRLPKDRRSWLMSRIGARDTRPELTVRRTAHALGLRFRLHQRALPGTPDLVFRKYGTVVFVHGCFWHRHANCRKAGFPKSNMGFWRTKFDKTVVRDEEIAAWLKRKGWRVEIIWECETKNTAQVASRLVEIFGLELEDRNVRRLLGWRTDKP